MLQLIADKLAVGALLISQLLLTAVVGTEPYFQDVNLVVNSDRLFCSGQLVRSFTPDLDVLLQSGDTVVMHFEVDLVEAENDSAIVFANWEHQFIYSILDDKYTVYRSEKDQTQQLFSFEAAKAAWVTIEDALLCRMRVMEDDERYYLKISAFMDEMMMPGIHKKINMMSFWNRIRPVHVSEQFEKRQLVL